MNKIYSQKEFESLKKDKVEKTFPEQVFELEKELAQPASETEYFYLYPDNPKSGFHSGVYTMMYGDSVLNLNIIDGVIKTDKKDIGDHLLSKGFIFMYEKK